MAMALGDYFSSKCELEYAQAERARESWEMHHYPQGERNEMIDLYKLKGMSEEDSKIVVNTMSKYHDIFVDHMMVEELHLNVPDDSESPCKAALVMFLAFTCFGGVPLIVFVATLIIRGDTINIFIPSPFFITCIATGVTLFSLGAAKATFIKQKKLKSGLLMVFNGAMATGTGYGIATVLNNLIQTHTHKHTHTHTHTHTQ
eukprot:GHVR01096581.1.p1 GENE.GHVR01096581.1~~GHVR01096581.1.p1  ORF type:complete len:202 (+),score=71.87 GHVR01096581.1:501-1106(+)